MDLRGIECRLTGRIRLNETLLAIVIRLGHAEIDLSGIDSCLGLVHSGLACGYLLVGARNRRLRRGDPVFGRANGETVVAVIKPNQHVARLTA